MNARSSFGPVVLLGLASSALAFAASVQGWAEPVGSVTGVDPGAAFSDEGMAEVPLAEALSLVVLALWGVLLVTRGWVRRLLALVAALTSVGFLATLVWAADYVLDQVRENYLTADGGQADVAHTGWYWTAWVAGVLCLVAGALAVRFAPSWPEMGSRYDAPGTAPEEARPVEEQSNLEVWKSLDEGHDPTQ